jgi:DNA-binding transcriptional regulator YiaG
MMAKRVKRQTAESVDVVAMLQASIRDDAKMQRLVAEERSNAAVARQIHALRTAHGLTQKQLAALIGTTQPVIARLEDADYQGQSLAMLRRIGAALGYSVAIRFVPNRRVGAKRR